MKKTERRSIMFGLGSEETAILIIIFALLIVGGLFTVLILNGSK